MSKELTKRTRNPIGDFFGFIVTKVMGALDVVFGPLQNIIGVKGMAYFFILPNLLIFGIFVLFPMVLNFYFAFTGGPADLTGREPIFLNQRELVGTDNFAKLFDCTDFSDPSTCDEDIFWRAVYNTIRFVAIQVGFMVFFSLVTALVLNRNIIAKGFFRSVFFYPVLLSPVVVALIWKWILQRNGLLNAFLVNMGGEKIPFLIEPNWAFFWIIFISIWAHMGFYTLILLAGLQAIPGNLYEAGNIDGTNPWQAFRFITLPMLMPTLLVVLVLSLIRSVQTFEEVNAFTGGGPGSATTLMVQYIYKTGFSDPFPNYGLASAASVLLGVTLLLFTLVQLYLGRRSDAV